MAVLVAPGKSDGLAWDGTGKLPEDAVEQLKNFEGEGLIGGMVEDSGAGNVLRAGGSIAQWSADAFLGGMAQPEVRVELFLNGKQLLTTGGTEPSYNPTWPDAVTDPLLLRPDDRIALKAWDEDPSNDDEIGMCTLLGRPPVDAHGYVEEHAFRCHGQLLSVARSGRTCVAWDEFGRQARQIVLRCGDY